MSVHYKFKSALEYDTVTFDGLHISVKDLKNAIIQQKRIGRNTDFDLQITNAQTKEVYEDEDALIPKNTSLLIARIPLVNQVKSKPWEGYGGDSTPPVRSDDGPISKAVDLANLDAPEDDKIKAMMSQSTQDYDPSNYMKIRGANQMGAVPPNYRCYKCHQAGHWIKDCPLNQCSEPIEIKKSTGIPRSFMVPVEGPQVPGAMITPNGQYAVPALDHQAYTQKQAPAPIEEVKPDIPEDLVCTICSDLLTDAVMIPCCGNSFCDECIRSCLLESEEHECPDCHEKDISPGTLIPNRYLRNSVSNFKNNTGYVKKHVHRASTVVQETKHVPHRDVEVAKESEQSAKSDADKSGTVISEADSTEPPKSASVDFGEVSKKESVADGPPGVSPRQSPKAQPIKNMMNAPRSERHRDRDTGARHTLKRSSRERSPHRHRHRSHRSPSSYGNTPTRQEERAGTPTIDEPGLGPPTNYPPNMPYGTSGPPGIAPPVMGLPQPSIMQGPPPYPPGQPPPGVYPPPNFRLPPPAYMPPGPYSIPPRPVFDGGRPPMSVSAPYAGYAPRSRGREYLPSRSLRGRTPPGIIDDPLEAFNRMLREKDERERRAKARKGRSYSRSSSRSLSRSPRRLRSRSPRRRTRSRSRSFSPGPFSPRNSPRRRANSRYRSPLRSPPPARYRYKDGGAMERGGGRDYERDYGRDGYSRREFRERERDLDDYGHFDGYERDRGRQKGQWGGPVQQQQQQQQHQHQRVVPPEGYYPPPEMHQQMAPYPIGPNRYPPRDPYPPPYMNKPEPVHPPPQHSGPLARRYEDVAPPGVEQPPIPGLEGSPRFEERFSYGRESYNKSPEGRREAVEKRRHVPAPEKQQEVKKHESPERHKRRRRDESSDRDEKHKRDTSDDEKSKKSKEKKRRKEKKEAERKKRKEKKEKSRKGEDKKKDAKESSKKIKPTDEETEPPSQVPENVVDEEIKVMADVSKPPEPEIKSPKVADEQQLDLYGDIVTEGIDAKVVENYGKIDGEVAVEPKPEEDEPESSKEDGELPKDEEEEEKDVLELHSSEADFIKAELDKNDILAPMPEKSKWELDEEPATPTTPTELAHGDPRYEKAGKVTNEVLKRAENAIFAKAINAIRPIEIKKISVDRAKLYTGERERGRIKSDQFEVDNLQVTIAGGVDDSDIHPPGTESKPEASSDKPAQRLSVKERLGVKVDDLDRIVKVERPFDRNLSKSLSPLSKRASEMNRNYSQGERRVELEERKRHERRRGGEERDRRRRSSDRREVRHDESHRREGFRRRDDGVHRSIEHHRERSRGHHEHEQKREKRKRSRSRSESRDKKADRDKKKRAKDKKQKKEKGKKHHKKDEDEAKEEKPDEAVPKLKSATDKRKPTLDEANFEPDYDLESESEKEDDKKRAVSKSSTDSDRKSKSSKDGKKKASSSSESSDSSSEEDRKRKKHRKQKRKKAKKDTSSSSSDSESDSSDDEKEKKRRKHKKKQKKKKKSKHK